MLFSLFFAMRPSSNYAFQFYIEQYQEKNFTFSFSNLIPQKIYEFKVSRPSTSPVLANFIFNDNVYLKDATDEKAVFSTDSDEAKLILKFTGSGFAKEPHFKYIVPAISALEQQFIGLTKPIWNIILILLPILIFSLFVTTYYLVPMIDSI